MGFKSGICRRFCPKLLSVEFISLYICYQKSEKVDDRYVAIGPYTFWITFKVVFDHSQKIYAYNFYARFMNYYFGKFFVPFCGWLDSLFPKIKNNSVYNDVFYFASCNIRNIWVNLNSMTFLKWTIANQTWWNKPEKILFRLWPRNYMKQS